MISSPTEWAQDNVSHIKANLCLMCSDVLVPLGDAKILSILTCLVCCSSWVLSCSAVLLAAQASCTQPSSPTSGCYRFTWMALSSKRPANSPTARWLKSQVGAHFIPSLFFLFFLTQYVKCVVRWSLFRSWVRPSTFFWVWFHRHLQLLSPPASSHR